MAVETNYNDGDARARLADSLLQALGVADLDAELHQVDVEDRNDMAVEAYRERDKSIKVAFFDEDNFGSKQHIFATYLPEADGPCVVRVVWETDGQREWSALTHFRAFTTEAAAQEAVDDVKKALGEFRKEQIRLYGPSQSFEDWREQRRQERIEKYHRRHS